MKQLDLLVNLQKEYASAYKHFDGLFGIDDQKVHLSEELFKELFKTYTVNLKDETHKICESYYDGVKFIALLD